ncbi:hypothetical protein [Methanothrix soehngenii]|nr:hypothetical protein [Methanothrix soehngenii]HNQ53697.1 hypothetical protein [Methanothrix soehngenii]
MLAEAFGFAGEVLDAGVTLLILYLIWIYIFKPYIVPILQKWAR